MSESWEMLFERARNREVTLETVREALTEHRDG